MKEEQEKDMLLVLFNMSKETRGLGQGHKRVDRVTIFAVFTLAGLMFIFDCMLG